MFQSPGTRTSTLVVDADKGRVSGKAAGAFVGMVALLLTPAAGAEVAGTTGGTGSVPAVEAPDTPAQAPSGSGGTPATGRPTLSIFEAAPGAAVSLSASRAVVRFQIRDSARQVRVRLAFVNLAGAGTKRVNLGRRRTGLVHSIQRSLPPGSYRVRLTAINPNRRRVVRSTTMEVAAPAPAPAAAVANGVFPVRGAYDFGGPDARFGAPRSGHTHQGQDIPAAEGTPVVAPKAGTIHWRAYQAGGAGYYLVLAADGENYMYVFMHLRQGSVPVSKGDHVAAGQQIAQVGNTGGSFGAHLHFEVWDGVWYGGGHPIDPLPILKAWEAGS
jgi:murein DD-endopeptidase MepM/ murein hydrolase activator NlpD